MTKKIKFVEESIAKILVSLNVLDNKTISLVIIMVLPVNQQVNVRISLVSVILNVKILFLTERLA